MVQAMFSSICPVFELWLIPTCVCNSSFSCVLQVFLSPVEFNPPLVGSINSDLATFIIAKERKNCEASRYRCIQLWDQNPCQSPLYQPKKLAIPYSVTKQCGLWPGVGWPAKVHHRWQRSLGLLSVDKFLRHFIFTVILFSSKNKNESVSYLQFHFILNRIMVEIDNSLRFHFQLSIRLRAGPEFLQPNGPMSYKTNRVIYLR